MSEDRKTLDLILRSAEAEFLEKGFQNASLRTIVKNAGVTTGAFYRYYSSKEALFSALVEPHAAYIMHIFISAIEDWNNFSDNDKIERMTELSTVGIDKMLEYIYEHYSAFKLLICSASGSMYEDFIHDIVEADVDSTLHCAEILRGMGHQVPELDKDFIHMICSALFSGIFEIVAHDMDKADATRRVHQLRDFFTGGWSRIMNCSFG